MSDHPRHPVRMKNRIKNREGNEAVETLLAVFGEAQLVRAGNRVYLDGGSMVDRMEAIEWAKENLPGVRVQSRLEPRSAQRSKAVNEL